MSDYHDIFVKWSNCQDILSNCQYFMILSLTRKWFNLVSKGQIYPPKTYVMFTSINNVIHKRQLQDLVIDGDNLIIISSPLYKRGLSCRSKDDPSLSLSSICDDFS